jgi:hypothetical protein
MNLNIKAQRGKLRRARHLAVAGIFTPGAVSVLPPRMESLDTSLAAQIATATSWSQWHECLAAIGDFEGPLILVTGTSLAFSLGGNTGGEILAEPLERVNLSTAEIAFGVHVSNHAEIGAVGRTVLLLAMSNYKAPGVASGPWELSTVINKTLQRDRRYFAYRGNQPSVELLLMMSHPNRSSRCRLERFLFVTSSSTSWSGCS